MAVRFSKWRIFTRCLSYHGDPIWLVMCFIGNAKSQITDVKFLRVVSSKNECPSHRTLYFFGQFKKKISTASTESCGKEFSFEGKLKNVLVHLGKKIEK